MRILQVCPRYFPQFGGVEEHVRNISERLAKIHEVTVATTDPSRKLVKEEIVNSVRILRFKSWAPNESYYFSTRLKKYLKLNSSNFDVVHAHSYHAFPSLYAAQAKRRNGLVFTAHYHGTGHTLFRALLHRPYKFIAGKIFEKADRVICVSNYEKNLITKRFRIDKRKIVVIPNGVSSEDFNGLKRQEKGFRSILYVGRLEKYKGIKHLITAMPKVDSDVVLELVGAGPFREQLAKYAKKLGLQDRVRFEQNLPRKELLQKYVDADLFVSLSRHEAYGVAVAEALSAGVPCLVGASSGLAEWIDGEHCLGIDFPIDIDILALSINKNIGRKIDKPNLPSWEIVVDRVAETYESVLKSSVGD